MPANVRETPPGHALRLPWNYVNSQNSAPTVVVTKAGDPVVIRCPLNWYNLGQLGLKSTVGAELI